MAGFGERSETQWSGPLPETRPDADCKGSCERKPAADSEKKASKLLLFRWHVNKPQNKLNVT